MAKILYAEIKVQVYIEDDQVPNTLDEPDPFEDAVDSMEATLENVIDGTEWEGLSDNDDVEIKVTS